MPVHFGQVFPHGCYAVGQVEPVRDFDASTRDRFVQGRDAATGELLWQVEVLDADPEARDKTVKVKLIAPVQPVLPDSGGAPFVPVEFDGMTVTPWVNGNNRLAYSIKAQAVRAAKAGARPHAATGKEAAA
ncbi:plasmid replication, integration and excision activator [Bailinhaonella thermotolerans]|uniref:Plasmid replication, integration and excision activator n=1 Tax=Bailinhaonella thermotolerans TaxID=1070861 RepID=A0A3A3ZW83_9ACTN|nr:plasmid replication, integration and excision activator [Bailinhaonella thermotolerans]RJL18358.1 plasmid replication, integration and excision activator [Bailinhaonella thermotolerans]